MTTLNAWNRARKLWPGQRLILEDRTKHLLRWKAKEEARKGKPMNAERWERIWSERFSIGEYVSGPIPANFIKGRGNSWEAAFAQAEARAVTR